MSPKILRDGWTSTLDGGALLLTHPGRGQIVLLGVAARLFELADGTRTVAELAALLKAVPEDIFSALDELGDHGLLAARVAPPAAPRARSRREVLGALAGVAVAASLPSGVAAAGELTDDPAAKEKKRKHAAPDPAAEDAKMLAAKPPREQVYKESSAKDEQQRKMLAVKASEEEQKLAPQLAREESKKVEAELLLAFEDAATRVDSPSESEAKKLVELPAELAAMDESSRKKEVAPLRVEEQAAKASAVQETRALWAGERHEQALKLAAREQKAKLLGEFGDTQEQAHKALIGARERHRKQASEQQQKDLRRAEERRHKADLHDGRVAEQDEKAVVRAREQHTKQRQQERSEKLTGAEEQREKHRQQLLEQYQQRRAERLNKFEQQAAAAKTDQAREKDHKDQAAEQTQKYDAVDVELRAAENSTKSTAPREK